MRTALAIVSFLGSASIVPAGPATAASAQGRAPGHVTIYRDDWGVPHVYAELEEEGYFGLGYALAEDRLETVLDRFLWVRAELAAAFGTERAIESDFNQRRWRHLEEARKGFHRLSPQLQKNYGHFVSGIRRFMDDHPERIPPWSPPLEPALPIAVTRAWLWSFMGNGGAAECEAAGVALAPDVMASLREGESSRPASNEWVLMPSRTAAGITMHFTDSHGQILRESASGLVHMEMFEYRMQAGALKVAGSGFAGVPWFYFGHTRTLAWGVTDGTTDVADCYELDLDPKRPGEYRQDGVSRALSRFEVTIEIKDRDPIRRTFEYADLNGVLSPIVARRDRKAYAVSTPYMHRAGGVDEQFYLQQLARNMDELIEAQRMVELEPSNMMFAEAFGNVLYVREGRVPIRPPGYDWKKPVPGNTSATAWRGIHSLEDLVHLKNPPQGYMQNNNVAPDTMLEGSPLTADRYPSYLFGDEPGDTNTRGVRAVELLSRASGATEEDFTAMALDEKLPASEAWLAALRRAADARVEVRKAKGAAFERFLEDLLEFDGFARKESAAALKYFYWRTELVVASSGGGIEELGDAIEGSRPLASPQEELLFQAVEKAMTAMLALPGGIELRYGDVFRVGRGDLSLPVGGGGFRFGDRREEAIRQNGFDPPDDRGRRSMTSGQRQPMVTFFTRPVRSFSALPFGQSEDPASSHYSDQAQLTSERRFKPTYFDEADLMKHVASKRILEVRTESGMTVRRAP